MAQEFERWDGEKFDVNCVACGYCKNYFWVRVDHSEIEQPKFCCWCGGQFDGITELSGEDMNDKQT